MRNMSYYKILNFNAFGDEDGLLISLEQNHNIPFEIKRVYYIFNTNYGVIRGKHAHKNLEQVLICTSGSCKVSLDDGENKQEYTLNCKTQGLYIKDMIWREMFDFSNNCVLMVLASELYNENDYVRSYEEFIKMCK